MRVDPFVVEREEPACKNITYQENLIARKNHVQKFHIPVGQPAFYNRMQILCQTSETRCGGHEINRIHEDVYDRRNKIPVIRRAGRNDINDLAGKDPRYPLSIALIALGRLRIFDMKI